MRLMNALIKTWLFRWIIWIGNKIN